LYGRSIDYEDNKGGNYFLLELQATEHALLLCAVTIINIWH